MQFIKVTSKGNVKVEHASGVKATAYFTPDSTSCVGCALHEEGMCNFAPCTPGERGQHNLPRQDGSFTWDKP